MSRRLKTIDAIDAIDAIVAVVAELLKDHLTAVLDWNGQPIWYEAKGRIMDGQAPTAVLE